MDRSGDSLDLRPTNRMACVDVYGPRLIATVWLVVDRASRLLMPDTTARRALPAGR